MKIQCVVGNGRRTVPRRDYETFGNECLARNEERCSERSLQQSEEFFTAPGGLQGGLGVTHNLVWVADPETHPGATRPLSLRASPPTEGIFRGAVKELEG